MNIRIEKDTMGDVEVPAHVYWGAQTQRSLNNFKIGELQIPKEIIHSLAIVKKAAAFANCELNVLASDKKELIAQVCDEIIEGKLDDSFPLIVWQTGSGTQTNMNVNEVISNRAELINGGKLTDDPKFISPNDDVNKSQSTNDVFPTAMRIAAYLLIVDKILPALEALQYSFEQKASAFHAIIKIGRTHLMDATPMRLGDEFLTFASQIKFGNSALKNSLFHLSQLPIGGTAVGTGLNTPPNYTKTVVHYINLFTQQTFYAAENKFEAMASHDAFVETSNALKQLAISITKIANDIRLSGSGPRSGLAEINIPQNEPGSSIMPGKVNPTQCEAMTMVCAQVIGNDATIGFAALQGHFQLNTFMPVIAYNIVMSIKLLTEACDSFRIHCIEGITPNEENIAKHLNNSLMLVTALNPHIGYYNAAKIAQHAYTRNITLKEAALELKLVSEKDFDTWVKPEEMI
ncbi:MAG: class II fumarate hydratase [Bacteroidales bacterium]|jgi:fumarate hydratase class II|nr:class II fumarate hydratase [Bacteroidales bacterium]